VGAFAALLACPSISAADDPQPVLEGQVVDEAGSPAAGVTVSAIGWKQSQSVATDPAGNFRVPVDPSATGRIHVLLSAEANDGRLGMLSVSQEKPAPVRIILKPALEFVVLVRDSDGMPIAGADVEFLADMRRLAAGQTDAAGRWTCRVPADARSWAVFARKGRVGFDYATAEQARRSQQELLPLPKRLTLTLDGARSLRVKAVDQQGKPLAGVHVGPWNIRKLGREADVNLSGTTQWWPTTGADGIMVLDWLPRQFELSLPIMTRCEGYSALEHYSSITADKPADELTIQLFPREELAGRVTHAGRQPAAGILVLIRGQGAGSNSFQGTARTDDQGRYQLKVDSEQVYIVAVSDTAWAAPYRAGLVVRAGKPVHGVDLVLGPATRLHGRVTVGPGSKPAAAQRLSAVIDAGQIPAELRRQDDQYYRAALMYFWAQTDADGRYEFHLGPGEYSLRGPPRTEPVKITIPTANPPAELVHDFHMPRPEMGPFTARVVDVEGQPISVAKLSGRYASSQARRWFPDTATDEKGVVTMERSLDPLVLHARTADGKLAGVAHIDAEAVQGEVVIGPLATASGRLCDLQGQPLAQRELRFGIRIFEGEPGRGPFSDNFGGITTTDSAGRFSISGLVPGQTYHLSIQLDESSSRGVTEIAPRAAGALDLGDLKVDPDPIKPYVPPTPTERTAAAFVAQREASPDKRLKNLLAEAAREYTRPLLLFGQPADKTCIELFRLFEEDPEDSETADTGTASQKLSLPSPSELRWEFELAALDIARPEVSHSPRHWASTQAVGGRQSWWSSMATAQLQRPGRCVPTATKSLTAAPSALSWSNISLPRVTPSACWMRHCSRPRKNRSGCS
jgi:hypothetical protein